MSIRHIAAVADLTGLSSTRKAILYSLAIDADGQGHVELKRARLEQMAGVRERTLRDSLLYLEKRRLLHFTGQTRSFLTLTL